MAVVQNRPASERQSVLHASRWGWPRLIMLGLIWLGFGARVWRLGAQSLWLDEALSVVFARPALGPMLSTLANQDLHPPLYYLILHFWIRVAGQSEFAVRFPSVVEGLPVVAATYALGATVLARPGDRGRPRVVALLGALFIAGSPFMVYYAQEARMYSLLASLGTLSSLALWKVVHRDSNPSTASVVAESGAASDSGPSASLPTRAAEGMGAPTGIAASPRLPILGTREGPWLIAYALFTAAMLYTQYFGGLVVAFQGLYLLGTLARDRRVGLRGIWGLAGAAVLYLPWTPFALQQVDRLIRIPDFWKGDFQLSFLVSHMFAVFAFGQFAALGRFVALAIVLAGLVGIAFAVLAWRAIRHGGGELYLLVYLLVPFGALYALLVRDPKFTERYLITIFPPFYLVFALGVVLIADRARRMRWSSAGPVGLGLGGLLSLALLGVSLSQLVQVYDGPGYRKDDNRGVYRYIEQHDQPGDVVVLMMNTWEPLAYYTRGDLDWAPLQPGGDRVYAANELNKIAAGHRRMWLVLWNPDWADPTQFVRQSVNSAYARLPVSQQFTGIDLRLYQIDPAHTFAVRTTPDHPEAVDFGNRLQLLGYDLPDPTVTAGQSGKVTLYWKGLGQLDQDYVVSLRLTDGTFQWWQKDDRPAAYTYPTNYWPPGEIIGGEKQFAVPPGTPPGRYHLQVQVYAQGGATLNILRNSPNGQVPGGITATIADIQVERPTTPPDVAKLGIPASPSGAFGDDLRLLGSQIATNRVAPGGSVDLTLWWQALRAPLPYERVRLRLATAGRAATLYDGPPSNSAYPTTEWTMGEVAIGRYRVVIPADAPPGADRLLVDVSPGPSDTPIDLGAVDVLDQRRLTTPPTGIQNPTDLQVGSFARLVGYDLSAKTARPGDTIHLTLYWHAGGGSGATGYTVFAHVLNRQSLIFAQQDHPPGDGNDPTSGWIAGEYVVDHYDLTLKPDAPPGAYQIEVGMYDPTTGARLTVADGKGQKIGDRMLLGAIEVTK